MVHYEFLNQKEAECYLDIFCWNADATLKGIEQDITWERNSANLLSRQREFFKNHLERNMNVTEEETKIMEDEDSGSERQRMPVVNVAILGVNRYIIQECGIEMKDLSRLVLNSIEHNESTGYTSLSIPISGIPIS